MGTKELTMRLLKLETEHALSKKLILELSRITSVSEPLDVLKIFMYRPEYFGNHFCRLVDILLRGPSDWSVGERELFGAFTSKLNQCVF
jgi:hypothetical protein